VRATASLLALDPAPFEQIFAQRAGTTSKLTETEANDLFAAYMEQIERVIEAIDRIEK